MLFAARAAPLEPFERRKWIRPPGFATLAGFVLRRLVALAIRTAYTRDETFVNLGANIVLRHQRQRKQQFLFDQLDEIELAPADQVMVRL